MEQFARQTLSNMFGTLGAAAVIYVVGTLAGVFNTGGINWSILSLCLALLPIVLAAMVIVRRREMHLVGAALQTTETERDELRAEVEALKQDPHNQWGDE